MSVNKTTLLDGGLGRELKERGIPINTALWSAEVFYRQPELLQTIHEEFIEAGAEIITSNTYALTHYNLSNAGKDNDFEKLLNMAYASANAAKAKYPNTKIAAALPPLTESYRYDLIDPKRLSHEYHELVKHALAHQADILLGETLTTQEEVSAFCKATQGQGLPVWLGLSVGNDGNLRSGESVTQAARYALDNGVDAILVNCSDIFQVTEGVKQLSHLAQNRHFAFGAYANRFVEVKKDFTLTTGIMDIDDSVTIDKYCEIAKTWESLGASIIGGCCGIGPDYIKALHNTLAVA